VLLKTRQSLALFCCQRWSDRDCPECASQRSNLLAHFSFHAARDNWAQNGPANEAINRRIVLNSLVPPPAYASARTDTPRTLQVSGEGWSPPPGHEDIGFSDIEVCNMLGQGTFGCVNLAKHKVTGKLYALKQLSKANLVKAKQGLRAIAERNVLRECR